MAITIVGLGPGDSRYLTKQAWDELSSAELIYLRTNRHPAVSGLPDHCRTVSFDHVYESAESFEAVYERIATELLRLGRDTDLVYAVPGHPMIGESTVTAIVERAKGEGLQVRIIPGLSFIEPTLAAVGRDGLEGLQLFDAIEIAKYNHPPVNIDAPLLLGQVHSKLVANELKLALMALYPDEHEVVLVHAAGTESQVVEIIPLFSIDHSEHLAHLTSLYVPELPLASSLPSLAETVAYLRGPDGCPWDQEQTRQSLREGFLEEAGEVMAALDADNPKALCEELGDLLYHIVMQTQIASELGEFNLANVISGIESKLKRRHPHVWGDWEVIDSDEVVRNWEKLKLQERELEMSPPSLLDNIPYHLPALSRSQTIQDRVRRAGFDWPSSDGVIGKVGEELAELEAAESPIGQSNEFGDVLFALVNWARWKGIEAETALRECNLRFEQRFRLMERMARERNLDLAQLDLQTLDAMWNEAKTQVASLEESVESEVDPTLR